MPLAGDKRALGCAVEMARSPVASHAKQPKTDGAARLQSCKSKTNSAAGLPAASNAFNVVISILIAGWVPSVLMLVVSYTILTRTLESKILRDRQTFVQLIAHLVGDDLGRSGAIVDYYQTYPQVAQVLTARYPDVAGKNWLQDTYFSHPRIDGMFITNADGRLIASLPDDPAMMLNDRDFENLAGGRAQTPRVSMFRRCIRARPITASRLISSARSGRPMVRRLALSASPSWSNASDVACRRSTSPTRIGARSSTRMASRSSVMISKRIQLRQPSRPRRCSSDIRGDKTGHQRTPGHSLFIRPGRVHRLDDGDRAAARSGLQARARSAAENDCPRRSG